MKQELQQKYSNEQILSYTNQLKDLVEKCPHSFFRKIKSKKYEKEYGNLKKFIFDYT